MKTLTLKSLADLMATRKTGVASEESVGDRIRRLRKTKGLSQTELGKLVGISQRLVVYYETQGGSASPDLLLRFAQALEVHPNALLGVDQPRRAAEISPQSVRLWRRFQRLEELPTQDKKTVLKMIDALADRQRKRTG